jgi:hypothetical protein
MIILGRYPQSMLHNMFHFNQLFGCMNTKAIVIFRMILFKFTIIYSYSTPPTPQSLLLES